MLKEIKNTLTCIILCLLLANQAISATLPKAVRDELKRAKIPLSSVSIVVQQSDTRTPLISQNAEQTMNPASTMKLLTTISALDILGPAYQWKTEAYLDGKLENGVLQGDLIFKGYGDPKLTIERFWLFLRELRQRGLREIRGDVVLDHSFFEVVDHDPGAFDNDPTRPYNVGPNALLLNFNALRLRLSQNGALTNAVVEPALSGYTISNRITTVVRMPCGGDNTYKPRLEFRNIVLEGAIPVDCGEMDDYFALLPHDEYFLAVFSDLWKELGGALQGKLRKGSAPPNQIPFATYFSPPLSEVIRDINKYSNNTMARQLFLTLGTTEGLPGSIASSTKAITRWLDEHKLAFPELVLENGAGLSRTERISAQHLAQLLRHAAHSPFAAELEASLPILGVDGTVRKRFKDSELAGQAHLKTGTLEGVKSVAGYVHAKSGKQWIVVFIINHPNASSGQAAQDALVSWLQKKY